MKHTKNILKSLLIMIVAISLFTVSCSKDEGGSKPTNPTSITINAATINSVLSAKAAQSTFSGVELDFNNFTPNSGEVTVNATINAEVNIDTLKTELTSAFTFNYNGASIKAEADTSFPTANTGNDNAIVNISINAGNNTFAKDVETAYKVSDKTATLKLTITPNKKWNNTSK